MKVKFKYRRKLEGKTYDPGTHEVPDAVRGHWFFKAIEKAGDVAVLDSPVASPMTPEVAIAKDPLAEPVMAAVVPEAMASEAVKEAPKSKKKKSS